MANTTNVQMSEPLGATTVHVGNEGRDVASRSPLTNGFVARRTLRVMCRRPYPAVFSPLPIARHKLFLRFAANTTKLESKASEGGFTVQLAFPLLEAAKGYPEHFRILGIDHLPVAHDILTEDIAFCGIRRRFSGNRHRSSPPFLMWHLRRIGTASPYSIPCATGLKEGGGGLSR